MKVDVCIWIVLDKLMSNLTIVPERSGNAVSGKFQEFHREGNSRIGEYPTQLSVLSNTIKAKKSGEFTFRTFKRSSFMCLDLFFFKQLCGKIVPVHTGYIGD